MKHIIMALGALAIAAAVPAFAQDATTPPPAPPAPDATMAPPAAPTPPAADGSMAPAAPGTMSPGSSSSTMPSSGMQSSTPAPTNGPLPKCTAKVKDRCDQSATSERYALSADQAMKTGGVGDRRSDNAGMGKLMPGGHMMHRKMHHKMMHKTTIDAPAA